MQMKRVCFASVIALQLIGGAVAAQTVTLQNKTPNLRTSGNVDPEIAALKQEIEALKARLDADEKKLSATTLLLSGLDKSVGTLRSDFENHYHPLNAEAMVKTDQLYVQVDGKNYFVHNPYGQKFLLTAPVVATNPKWYLRPEATKKPEHGE